MSLSDLVKEVKRQDTIISTRYRQWLRLHADDPMPAHIAKHIMSLISTPQRVRAGSFSPSSSSQCLRRQELAFLGIQPEFGEQPDAGLMNVFNDGKWRHLRWQANLLAADILYDIEVPVVWPAMRAKGSVDGRGYVPEDHPVVRWRGLEFGLELKGTNPWVYKQTAGKDKQKDEHLAQIHRYFVQGGFDLFVVLYEDKASNKWTEWVIEPDPVLMDEAKEELRQLNEAVDGKQLHPMLPSCKIRRGPTWENCPYTRIGGVCERATWPKASRPKSLASYRN